VPRTYWVDTTPGDCVKYNAFDPTTPAVSVGEFIPVETLNIEGDEPSDVEPLTGRVSNGKYTRGTFVLTFAFINDAPELLDKYIYPPVTPTKIYLPSAEIDPVLKEDAGKPLLLIFVHELPPFVDRYNILPVLDVTNIYTPFELIAICLIFVVVRDVFQVE
jgi:hypothetical protein